MTTANEALLPCGCGGHARWVVNPASIEREIVDVYCSSCDIKIHTGGGIKVGATKWNAAMSRALQPAPLPLPRAVPPREPTDEMWQAAAHGNYRGRPFWVYLADANLDVRFAEAIWKAMYDAAPEAPLPGQSAEDEREGAIQALGPWLEHRPQCARWVDYDDGKYDAGVECNCGLSAEIAALRTTPSPAGQQGEAMLDEVEDLARIIYQAEIRHGTRTQVAEEIIAAGYRRASAQPTPLQGWVTVHVGPLDGKFPFSGKAQDEMRKAFSEAYGRHGLSESLFAAVTALLRQTAAESHPPAPAAMAEGQWIKGPIPEDGSVKIGDVEVRGIYWPEDSVEGEPMPFNYTHWRLLSHPRAMAEAKGEMDEIIRDVAELPDRTSPDDWPEAMLVTAVELRAILAAFNITRRASGAQGGS